MHLIRGAGRSSPLTDYLTLPYLTLRIIINLFNNNNVITPFCCKALLFNLLTLILLLVHYSTAIGTPLKSLSVYNSFPKEKAYS